MTTERKHTHLRNLRNDDKYFVYLDLKELLMEFYQKRLFDSCQPHFRWGSGVFLHELREPNLLDKDIFTTSTKSKIVQFGISKQLPEEQPKTKNLHQQWQKSEQISATLCERRYPALLAYSKFYLIQYKMINQMHFNRYTKPKKIEIDTL